jgi:hypothetical protein
MADDNPKDSHEINLLRLLIGYFHMSLTEQVALIRHGKGFHTLTQPEKDKLQAETIQSVLAIARSADASALAGLLRMPSPQPPFGKVN